MRATAKQYPLMVIFMALCAWRPTPIIRLAFGNCPIHMYLQGTAKNPAIGGSFEQRTMPFTQRFYV
jgi:hypothetical protein